MKSYFRSFCKFSILLGVFSAGAALIVSASFYLYLSPRLPSPETLRTVKLQTPLRVYSRDGRLMGEFGEKRRTPIRFEDIPQDFINAILAAEDDRFYDHNGVDITGLTRAAIELATTREIQSGGSTITMQLAQLLPQTRATGGPDWWRKVRQMRAARDDADLGPCRRQTRRQMRANCAGAIDANALHGA